MWLDVNRGVMKIKSFLCCVLSILLSGSTPDKTASAENSAVGDRMASNTATEPKVDATGKDRSSQTVNPSENDSVESKEKTAEHSNSASVEVPVIQFDGDRMIQPVRQIEKPDAPGASGPAKTLPVKHIDSTSTTSAVKPSVAKKPTLLLGRIEELANSPGATFPVLKALTPKLDLRGDHLSGTAFKHAESSKVVAQFPTDYKGVWGGNVTLHQAHFAPICWQIDPDETNRMQKILGAGSKGMVNFDFNYDRAGKLELEPARVTFMVQAKQTRVGDQLTQMMGGGHNMFSQLGGGQDMGQMMKQLAQNMEVPIFLWFGEINNPEMEGVSGNKIRATVLSNKIRELKDGVLEQQIVTEELALNPKTGRSRAGYAESVLRFTRLSGNQMYVEAAAVNYGKDRRYLRKIVLYGTVTRGRAMPTNPYGNIQQMLQGGGQGGLGGLEKLLQGAGSGNMKLPPGFNPLQGLFNR